MITFYGICRIYYPSDLLRIFKESCQVSPAFVPGFQDIRIFPIPLLMELFQSVFCIFQIHCTINFLQICTGCLTILVQSIYINAAGILPYVKELLCKMAENLQSDTVQSCQAVFVRCCLNYYFSMDTASEMVFSIASLPYLSTSVLSFGP